MMTNRNEFTPIAFALGLALAGCGDDGSSPADTDSAVTSGPTASDDTSGADATDDADSSGTGESDGRRGTPPALGQQIDRAGRAAISTATIETFQADGQVASDEKDAYNAAATGEWPGYVPQMMTSLAILDALDANCGNQLLADAGDNRYEFLASVLADDRLWLNSDSGTCGTYLGVEAEAIGAVEPGTGGCGGRTPADDVIERSYSVLAAGILAGIDDGVVQDDGAQTDTFPFLGAPL